MLHIASVFLFVLVEIKLLDLRHFLLYQVLQEIYSCLHPPLAFFQSAVSGFLAAPQLRAEPLERFLDTTDL